MSRVNDVYEDLKEYVEIINSRVREIDDMKAPSDTVLGLKIAYERVEEELERILEGKGL